MCAIATSRRTPEKSWTLQHFWHHLIWFQFILNCENRVELQEHSGDMRRWTENKKKSTRHAFKEKLTCLHSYKEKKDTQNPKGVLKLTVRIKNRSERSHMTSVTICSHDCNSMFSVMYLSAPCLCCVFHGLGALTFSWQMFGFLRFKWKTNYCFIQEEFCTKLKYW